MSDMVVFIMLMVICTGLVAWTIWGEKNNHPKDGDLP